MSSRGLRETHGNIFADLGRPGADAHYLKAQIVAELYRLTQKRKLTQAKAGELMGITQPEVSRLFRGHFREYSVERLMTFLTAYGLDVEIVSRPRPPPAGADTSRSSRPRREARRRSHAKMQQR